MAISDKIAELHASLPASVQLVAVSKTYPADCVQRAYDAGQRLFGENRPQEMDAKRALLPSDIAWHMIGHLQTNKVKLIAPYVAMIHSVDSVRLLETIDAQALQCGRVIDILLEVRIAQEESKHGWDTRQLCEYLSSGAYRTLRGVCFRGVMGVATFTNEQAQVRSEFEGLHRLFVDLRERYFDQRFDTLSMGMSGDYALAIACGSTMVRIGSAIFGARDYSK